MKKFNVYYETNDDSDNKVIEAENELTAERIVAETIDDVMFTQATEIATKNVLVKTDNIKVVGYKGTWYVIGEVTKEDELYYVLEHETYGDETEWLCIKVEDGNIKLVYDDFYDLETLDYYFENENQ